MEMFLYLPIFCFLGRLAFQERLLNDGSALVALINAGVLDTVEVGHNVYKTW